jgi:predicted phosphate transport protein (TIGR00153 family)
VPAAVGAGGDDAPFATTLGGMAQLSRLFAPREREFFDLFEEAGRNAVEASALLERMLLEWPDHGDLALEIRRCEQEGDRITHDIINRLNQTFVTPFDREDIYGLASGLDDIVDYIEEVADFLGLYRIEAPMIQAQQQASILHQACAQLAGAIPRLRTFKDLHHFTVEVNRYENEGDRVLRDALASLFEAGIDPMLVIRWKDIFERLEDAVDATERAVNILEGITIKNT